MIMNYNDQLKAYRILASKSATDIRITVNEINNNIIESNDNNKFLNLSVWINKIENELTTLKLVNELSTKAYRKREKLEE